MLHPDRGFRPHAAVRPDCPDDGTMAANRLRLVRSHLAEPPHRGRGTHPSGANRTSRDGDPNAEPDSSPRRPRGRFEVRGVQAVSSVPSRPPRIDARPGATSPSTWSARSASASASRSSVSLLPTIARRGGLDPIGLAALAAAPFIANLLGAFAGRVGPRSARQMAAIRVLGAAALLPLFVVPTPPVMVAAGIVFWVSLSLSSPFQLRLWGAMYPARLRGRIVGSLGMGRSAAMAIASLAGGRHRRPDRRAGRRRPRAACSVRPARSPTRACGHPPRPNPRASRRAIRCGPSADGRSWRGSPWPRASTAAGSSRRSRCTPSSTSTASTSASAMSA